MNHYIIILVTVAAALEACSSAPVNEYTETQSAASIPYATSGPYYAPVSNTLGPCGNPYPISSLDVAVPVMYCGDWATTCATDGTTLYGMLTVQIMRRGTLVGCSWQQCGTPGASC